MVSKPYWQPSVSLSMLAQNMGIQPMTNWACMQGADGLRPFSAGHLWIGLSDGLGEQDIRLISALELDPELYNPVMCRIFENLMRALPTACSPGGNPQDTWIDELLCLMPPCDHDRLRFHSAAECAATYINRGMAPLLAPLYLLMLRSNTWIRRIQRCTLGPLHTEVPVPKECTSGYDLHELIGDPCATVQSREGWSAEFMWARERFFCTYGLNDEASAATNQQVEDLLFSLDTMAHVAAAAAQVPEYNSFAMNMRKYDRWSRQTPA